MATLQSSPLLQYSVTLFKGFSSMTFIQSCDADNTTVSVHFVLRRNISLISPTKHIALIHLFKAIFGKA